MSDQIATFVFDQLPVRGAVVQLSRSWHRMQGEHNYAPTIVEALGQAAAATGLIAQSLKFDGSITLQIQSNADLRMLVMQCNSDMEMRGMASTVESVTATSFGDLIDNAHCAITIDAGERPYQGIVEVSKESLVASLENYFERSVQVPSHIVLFASEDACSGILLQQMPGETLPKDDWVRMRLLLDTLRADELNDDEPLELLRKLFAEDDVRLFPARPVSFHCPCTTERAEEILKMLGHDDVNDAIREQGVLTVTCEYCGTGRKFDSVDISRLFADNVVEGTDRVQ